MPTGQCAAHRPYVCTEISILVVQEGRIWEIFICIASQVPVKVGQNLIYILGHPFKHPPVDVHLALLTYVLKFKYMLPVTFQYFMRWTAHTAAHGVSEHYLSFALTIPWSTDGPMESILPGIAHSGCQFYDWSSETYELICWNPYSVQLSADPYSLIHCTPISYIRWTRK